MSPAEQSRLGEKARKGLGRPSKQASARRSYDPPNSPRRCICMRPKHHVGVGGGQ